MGSNGSERYIRANLPVEDPFPVQGMDRKPQQSHRQPDRIQTLLLEKGIRIRNMSGMPGLSSHLRVTVGLPDANRLFISGVKESLGI